MEEKEAKYGTRMCVCVCERERDRETERQRQRERFIYFLYPSSFQKESGVRYVTFPLAPPLKCSWIIKQGL